jgi:hypothetical protein
VGHEPRHLVVEVSGVTGPVAGPGHLGDRHPVLEAVDPWGVGLQITRHHAHVQGPPVATSLSLVVTGGLASAEAAAALLRAPRSHVNHQGFSLFVELHRLDNGRPVDTERATPYIGSEHANLLR